MELHNMMEDIVTDYLKEILEAKTDICSCNQCRMDMAAYALNKVMPIYIVSSRGVIHTQNKKRNDFQQDIDTYSVVMEAVEAVSKTPRHGKMPGKQDNPAATDLNPVGESPAYFDGESMLPLTGLTVKLLTAHENKTVSMFNKRWNNPQEVVLQMEGGYSFWPLPAEALKEGIQKNFQFSIKIEKEGYETVNRYFEMILLSSPVLKNNINQQDCVRLDDIFLYQPGQNEESGAL
jgi:competence protein ComFB